MDIPATLEGRSGHGAERCRGRSLFGTSQVLLADAQARLLALGGAVARRHLTPTGEGSIHHLELGGGGRPLVLLHGAGGGGANWYRVLAPLAAHRRVLAPDLPGFGFSTPIRLRAPLGQWAAQALLPWLAARCPEGCDLVGTSFGALVALRLVQRARLPIRRVVLLDAAGLGRALPWPVRVACTRPGGALLLRHSTRFGIRQQLRWLMTATRLPPDHEDALVAYLHASACTEGARSFPRALQLFGGVRGQDERLRDDELRRVRVPILLAWGARDRFVPLAHAQRAARLLPDARLAVIPNAGHSPNWEQPDALLDAMQPFLAA